MRALGIETVCTSYTHFALALVLVLLSVVLNNVLFMQSDIADVPNEMSKNDKKGKVNQVKANVTPQTSSDMGQTYSSTQNNSSENKKGKADQCKPLTYRNSNCKMVQLRTKDNTNYVSVSCVQLIGIYPVCSRE